MLAYNRVNFKIGQQEYIIRAYKNEFSFDIDKTSQEVVDSLNTQLKEQGYKISKIAFDCDCFSTYSKIYISKI